MAKTALFLLLMVTGLSFHSGAQNYVFAQLSGSPVVTSGWNLQGAAFAGNITGNSEIILTNSNTNQSGAIFFNQPVNLSQCSKWAAEFDFRMFGGSMADGMAFCFLDVPPVGFVSGGGLGIPASANGLKVCFDTYNNCSEAPSTMPKIQIRWGVGYNECSAMPTLYNSLGSLNFIRSANYNRARIEYDNGLISVFVNNTLYLTGYQVLNFTGYFGFTASTGALTDIHSIKNVIIYTEMPASEAGNNVVICSGESAGIGTTSNPLYTYVWTPASGLSNPNVANPQVSLTNTGTTAITTKYIVQTSFANGTGCSSKDSVLVTVLPAPSLTISASALNICQGGNINFNAAGVNGGSNPQFQWFVNGIPAGTGQAFSSATLNNGDVVTCTLTAGNCNPVQSNPLTITVNQPEALNVSITSSTITACRDSFITFNALSSIQPVQYQWQVNGVNAGPDNAQFTTNALSNGDQVRVVVSSSASCITSPTATSNVVAINIESLAPPDLGPDRGFCPGASVLLTTNGFQGYLWSTGATGQAITVSSPGSYWVTARSGLNCPYSDTVNISAYSSPVVQLGADGPICTGGSRLLDAGNHSSYNWSTGAQSQAITVTTPGTYTVTVTNPQGCTGSGAVTITSLLPLPKDFLGEDTAICSYGSLVLKASGSFAQYSWNTGSSSPALEISSPGNFWLTVRDANGCSGTDTISVALKECLKGFYVPGGFTPNGDGKNDVFRPLLFGNVVQYHLRVFNRWGNLVFETRDPQKGWDGRIAGQSQATGVFIWSCSFTFRDEPPRVEKGTVLLIR